MLPKISLLATLALIVAAPITHASVRHGSRKELLPAGRSFIIAQENSPSDQDQQEANPSDTPQDDQNGSTEQEQTGGDAQASQDAGAPEQVQPQEVRIPDNDSNDQGMTMTPYQQPVNPYQ